MDAYPYTGIVQYALCLSGATNWSLPLTAKFGIICNGETKNKERVEILRVQFYFSVFYVCVVILLGVFFVSCKSGNVEISSPELSEIAEAVPEDEEALSVPDLLALNMEDQQDFILASYRDPELQEEVVGFFRALTGSRDVAEVVLSNAAANDIAPALAFALCYEESRYNPRAFNRNRNETVDRGLFQLNSASFPKLGVEDFYNPGVNASYGLSHLRWCLNNAGTEVAGLAMYNAGHSRVRSSGTPKNTLDYISRILKRQRKIEDLFIAEYIRIARTETTAKEKKTPFRLSLLTPLGR